MQKLFLRFYLFLERGEGREKERERNINVWLPLACPLLGIRPTTQACALTGNQTCNPLVHRPVLNPQSHTSQNLNAKFDVDSLLYLLSHFECDGHTVHMLTQWCLLPPRLVQWSHRCSPMHIPVHSPWLPGYITALQIVFVILIMAGLFPDRPRIFSYVRICPASIVFRSSQGHSSGQ